MNRLEKILDRSDELGMAAILGIFYFDQDERIKDEDAVKLAVRNTLKWLTQRRYTNVLIEINNECNVQYDHKILQPERIHELIEMAKESSVDVESYPAGIITEYRDGFGIAMNYRDKNYEMKLPATAETIFGDKSIKQGGALVWKY